MKRLTKYLFLLIAIFAFGTVDVNASQLGMGGPAGGGKIMKPEDVQNSTYIIGTHVFKDIEMTMPMIMAASKTINSDELDKMIIYRKTFKGEWINAITGETVKTPETFYIQHIDLQTLLGTPVLDGYFPGGYMGNSITGMLDVWWYDAVSVGVELWRCETEDGEYELVTRIDETENGYIENYIEVEIERGKKYYYKARLYREYAGKTTYSDFSESIFGSNTNIQIELGNSVIKVQEDGSFELESEIITDVTTNYEYLHTLYSNYDGWYEDASLKESYANGESIVVKTWLNEKGYYWVTTDAVEFSDISNQIEIDAAFELRTDFISKTDEGYLYNLYLTQEIDENIVMEVYYRDTASENDFIKLQDVSGNSLDVTIPEGKAYEYMVYLLYTDEIGENFGTPSTNVVSCSSSLEMPNLYYKDDNELAVSNIGLAEKFEVYTSDSKDGKYKLMKKINVDDMINGGLQVYPSYGEQHFKVRAVATINDEVVYSNFSWMMINGGVDYEIYNWGRDVLGNQFYELEILEPEDIGGVNIYEVDEEENERLVKTSFFEYGNSETITVPSEGSADYKIEFFYQYEDSKEIIYTVYEKLYPADLAIEAELLDFITTEGDKSVYEIYIYDLPVDAEYAEIYCSDTVDGTYIKEESVELNDGSITYKTEKNQTKYCKVRLTNDSGDYTDYSNVIKISDILETPVLESIVAEVNEYDGESAEELLTIRKNGSSSILYELYGSNIEDGKYKLISEFSGSALWGIEREKLTKYYKIRSFIYIDEEKVYSEYSNSVKLEVASNYFGYFGFAGVDPETGISAWGVSIGNYDDFESYYSTDGETYTKIDLPGDGRGKEIYSNSEAYPAEGTTNYYKFRGYIEIDGEKIFAEYSQIFQISNTNTVTQMVKPVLNVEPQGQGNPGSYVYDLSINYRDYYIYEDEEVVDATIDGWELYLDYTVEGKDYIEVDGTNYTMVADHTEFGVVPRDYIWGSGESYNYIARAYYYDGEEKIYSDWSDVLTIDAEVLGITNEPTE